MKPMNIEFLSEMARNEKEIPIVCSDMIIKDCSDESMEVFEQYIDVLHKKSVSNE